jgi:hypothetical protein
MTTDPTVHHETTDVSVGGVFVFGLGLTAMLVVVLFAVWLLFGYYTGRQAATAGREFPLAADQQNRLPPEPRLQTNPRQDLIDLRRAEDIMLNTYGWVDKAGGVVRIPIDQAMKLTLERGLPARANETKR